ncbi:hypothetical protein Pla22_32970 [Rubripirellula amarantea]|uniref:YcxB-like protein domain-containing protein n=1 Tax=Rubripirellula amarantea TaxID=2527999 RepID=A0A5C5WIA9_9BACT|nr:hypothetical protein [Rubripirellula amarantea]TWT50554.1 hypothetical protein Pla22_32970 [Rubripirellula amarantea]
MANPYRPTTTTGDPLDDAASEVSFRLSRGVLRHTTDHYLLHYIPKRLALGSLALIGLSGWAIFASAKYGMLASMTVGVSSLVISAAIYLAMAHQAKKAVRRKQADFGLMENSIVSVQVKDGALIAVTSNGQHQWPSDQVKQLRTHSGMLISPEPLLAIFIPKNNHSPDEAFKTLREKLSQRP